MTLVAGRITFCARPET